MYEHLYSDNNRVYSDSMVLLVIWTKHDKMAHIVASYVALYNNTNES